MIKPSSKAPENFMMPYSQEVGIQMQKMYKRLPEKSRRLYAGVETLKLSYGGISYIARLFGCTRDTILPGIKELNEKETLSPNRSRKAGGGRTAILEKTPDINDVFLPLLKEHTAGDPIKKKQIQLL